MRLPEATQKVHKINCKVNKQVAEAFVAASGAPNIWQLAMAISFKHAINCLNGNMCAGLRLPCTAAAACCLLPASKCVHYHLSVQGRRRQPSDIRYTYTYIQLSTSCPTTPQLTSHNAFLSASSCLNNIRGRQQSATPPPLAMTNKMSWHIYGSHKCGERERRH